MKAHHRKIPFRPPAKRYDVKVSRAGLLLRFLRCYVKPHRWSILFCILLSAPQVCSVYLMSYYGRIVVDRILVITPSAPARPPQVGAENYRVWTDESKRVGGASLPGESQGRRIDMGVAASARPPGAGIMLLTVFILYATTLIGLNFLGRAVQQRRIRVGRQIAGHLREDMHEKILSLSMSFHRAHSPGRLLSRILSDVEVLQQQLVDTIMMVSNTVIMICTGTVILLTIDWKIFLFVVATAPVYAVMYRYASEVIREISLELRHTNTCLWGFVSQKFDALKAVQAYGRERLERLNFHRLTSCFLRDALLQQRASAGLGRSAGIVGSAATTTIFLFGATRVMAGRMTLGEMLFSYSTAASLFGPVLELAQLNLIFANLGVTMQRVADILDTPLEITDAPDAVEFPSPVKRGFSLQHVAFSYDPENEEVESVLTDVNLHIPAGTWLCVMGPSGSGKTTLLYLLSRLYEPTNGSILVDGIPMKKIKTDSLRMRMGFVPQEAKIFSGTVRDNICYAYPDARPKQIMAAAKAAELHDFIMDMPVQYETIIGEKGTTLSGGQRQRLSLARALLTSPEVLILDDCTSALDADTEGKIQATLATILEGKTAVIVSQRVSMARRCHKICVVDNGVITEHGTHDELIARGGFYSVLHAQQTELPPVIS